LGAPGAEKVVNGGKEGGVGRPAPNRRPALNRLGWGMVVVRWLVLAFEFLEGLNGVEQCADSGEIYFGLRASGFFAPDFGAADPTAAGYFLRAGLHFEGVGGDFYGAEEAEAVVFAGDSLASDVALELGVGDATAGGDPALDVFYDLGDAAIVEVEFGGDGPLLGTLDFDHFVDLEVAGRWLADVPRLTRPAGDGLAVVFSGG